MNKSLTLAVLFAVLAWPCAAAEPTALCWPEFHGAQRDNIARESGLLKEWPKEGPKLLWSFPECGQGYAGVSVAEGLLFTTGDFGGDELVIALDLDGKLKWKAANGKAWKGAQPGSRTTPTWHDGILYQLNATGRLAAFSAADGKPLWSVDLEGRFAAQHNFWGYSENVIVDGDMLFCMPGGAKGRIVALDRKTGETVWANTEIQDSAGYSSPLLVTCNGVRQLIALARKTVLGVDVRTGKLLWSHKHEGTCDQNVTSPVFHDGGVFVTAGHKSGGRMVKINPDGQGVTEAWFGTDLDNCHGGVLYLDGYLYGSGCRLYQKGLVCVDFVTGKTMYNAPAIGKVSTAYADGLLYCLSNEGPMSLVDVTPKQARVISSFAPPWREKPPCLSHPVICGGRLYIRHLNDLLAYDLRARKMMNDER